MKLRLAHPHLYISLGMGVLVLLLASFNQLFSLLSLDRISVAQGQVWRVFTGNFVHFGWPHTLMNLAAFWICAFSLLSSYSPQKYICLIISCCLGVGLGIYFFSPQYDIYAGLSGAIHGFFVAGLMGNKRHPVSLNTLFIFAVFAKVIYEHLPGYRATDLQQLLPVAVAYDAHLYGALSGAAFGAITWANEFFQRKRQ